MIGIIPNRVLYFEHSHEEGIANYHDLFLGLPNAKFNGFEVGTCSEITWELFTLFGTGLSDRDRHYCFCFRGRECKVKRGEILNGILVTEMPIDNQIYNTNLVVDWLLEGCDGLPVHDDIVNYLMDGRDSEYGSALKKYGTTMYPEEGAVVGFTDETGSVVGAMIFKKTMGNRRYEVECIYFSTSDRPLSACEFYSQHTSERGESRKCFAKLVDRSLVGTPVPVATHRS